jgi:hypothetical protein
MEIPANWSLYHYIGNEIDDDSPAILTTRSLTKDFDDMINNENWESKGYETVVCR